MKIKLVLSGLLLVLSQEAILQQPQWVRYDTINSNLPDNHIHAIAFDSAGNAWIGTDFGLTQFDGSSWTTYNVGTRTVMNPVRAIVVDQMNNVWAGTDKCVVLFSNHTLHHTYFFEIFRDQLYGPTYRASSLMQDNSGNIWIGTGFGFARMNIQNVLQNLGTPDSAGNITKRNSYSLNTLDLPGLRYSTPEPPTAGFPIVQDHNGNIWVGFLKGLVKYDGTQLSRYDLTLSQIGRILSIQNDNRNQLWVGTYLNGLMRFDGANWEKIELPNSYFEFGGIQAITIDPIGNVWVGTTWCLLQFDGKNWIVHNTKNSDEPETINCIALGLHGSIWVGTDTGIAVYER